MVHWLQVYKTQGTNVGWKWGVKSQQHLKPFVWEGVMHTSTDLRAQVRAELQPWSGLPRFVPWRRSEVSEEKQVLFFTKRCYLLNKLCSQETVTPRKQERACFSNLHKSIVWADNMPEYERRTPSKEGWMSAKDLPPVLLSWATFWCMGVFSSYCGVGSWVWIIKSKFRFFFLCHPRKVS